MLIRRVYYKMTSVVIKGTDIIRNFMPYDAQLAQEPKEFLSRSS